MPLIYSFRLVYYKIIFYFVDIKLSIIFLGGQTSNNNVCSIIENTCENLPNTLPSASRFICILACRNILLKLCSILARLQFLLLSMNSATTTSANPCVHYEEMSLEQPLSASLTSIGAFSLVLLHFKLKVVLLLHATEKCLDIFPRIFSLHFVSQGPLNLESTW